MNFNAAFCPSLPFYISFWSREVTLLRPKIFGSLPLLRYPHVRICNYIPFTASTFSFALIVRYPLQQDSRSPRYPIVLVVILMRNTLFYQFLRYIPAVCISLEQRKKNTAAPMQSSENVERHRPGCRTSRNSLTMLVSALAVPAPYAVLAPSRRRRRPSQRRSP